MSLHTNTPAHLSVIFAEHIREEADGKCTIIGVFSSGVAAFARHIAPGAPAPAGAIVVPSLAMHVLVSYPADMKLQALGFSLLLIQSPTNQTELMRIDLPSQTLAQIAAEQANRSAADLADSMVTGQFNLGLQPLVLPGAGVLRVQARLNDDISLLSAPLRIEEIGAPKE